MLFPDEMTLILSQIKSENFFRNYISCSKSNTSAFKTNNQIIMKSSVKLEKPNALNRNLKDGAP